MDRSAATPQTSNAPTNNQPANELQEHSWRDFWEIHPAAAVFNKRTTPKGLTELAKDIDANGLKARIRTRSTPGDGKVYVIDGISRLDSMEKELGWQIVNAKGEWIGAASGQVEHRAGRTHEQIRDEVISFNAKRRHHTKEDLAAAIAETAKLEYTAKRKEFPAISGEKLPTPRSKDEYKAEAAPTTGRPKDELKAEIIKKAAEKGVSKRTVERVLARQSDRPKIATRKGRKKKGRKHDVLNPYRIEVRLSHLYKKFDKKREEVQLAITNQLLSKIEGGNPVAPVSVTYPDGSTREISDLIFHRHEKRGAA